MRHIDLQIDNLDMAMNNDSLIWLNDIYLPEDLSYISGTCNPNLTVADDGKCYCSVDSGETFVSAECETSIVKRMGFVDIDGTLYPVEDGLVTYSGEQFQASYIKNDTGDKFDKAYVLIDDVQYDILSGQSSDWKNVKKVKVYNPKPSIIYTIDAQPVGVGECIEINNNQYDVYYSGSVPFIGIDGELVFAEPHLNESGETEYKNTGTEVPTITFNRADLGLVGTFSVMTYDKVSDKPGKLVVYLDSNQTPATAVNTGDIIRIKEKTGTTKAFGIDYDYSGNAYVNYYGVQYPVSADCKIEINIDDVFYPVEFSGYLNDDMWVGTVSGYPNTVVSAMTSQGRVSDILKRTLMHEGNDLYWSNEPMEFQSYSGVEIDNELFIIENRPVTGDKNEEGDIDCEPEVVLPDKYDGLYYVLESNQNNSVIELIPVIPDEDQDKYLDEAAYMAAIAENLDNYVFYLCPQLLGYHIKNVGDVMYYQRENIENLFCIKQIEQYIHLDIPLSQAKSNNLQDEERVQDLLDERLMANVNPQTDIERDLYCPVYSIVTEDKNVIYKPVTKIRFNCHFRTRNSEDWSVNEDSVEENNDGFCSWNCLDYYYNDVDTRDESNNYQTVYNNVRRQSFAPNMPNYGDLLTYLNFTDNDVFYQKSALAKSFLRLSFFDSPIPNQQELLWTSTIFFDEGATFEKFINNRGEGTFAMPTKLGVSSQKGISVAAEPVDGLNPTFERSKRLGAEFEVTNKLETKTSSEGFYIYIYKDYATALHERTIYMRADFNHAKQGISIPMINLKHWDGDAETAWQAQTTEDIFNYRDGVTMGELLNYLYIPIKLVYNEELKCYTYHFTRLNEDENEEVNINLFEVKYRDESR